MAAPSKTRMDPPRNIPGRVLLFALEGPRRPWWLPVAMFLGGVAGGTIGVAFNSASLVLLGVPTALLALLWTFTRLAQFYYYKAVGRTTDFSRCLRCGYPLDGLQSPICPECGTDSRRLAAAAKRATSVEP